jgi:hypothetical protein
MKRKSKKKEITTTLISGFCFQKALKQNSDFSSATFSTMFIISFSNILYNPDIKTNCGNTLCKHNERTHVFRAGSENNFNFCQEN